MPVVIWFSPVWAARTLLGETLPDRWLRVAAGVGVEVEIAVGEPASGQLDGRCLSLGGEALVTLSEGGPVAASPLADAVELAALEAAMLERMRERALRGGAQLVGAGVFLGPSVVLEPGCRVWGPCHLLGQTHVAAGAEVMPGAFLTDVTVGAGATIKPHTVATSAQIGARVQVGPFAHLRPGTVLGDGSKIGNFVETKNAVLAQGAKANHLAYLGDCEVGEAANVGAGTITCNYDGARKHRTVIGSHAFVGTNSSLVAPVRVGDGAMVAAGSVVVHDVPDGALAVGRSRQVNKEGLGARIAAANRAKKREDSNR